MKAYIYNLGQKFDKIVNENRDGIAIRYPEGAAYTYKALNKMANAYAVYLMSKRLRLHDVIAIFNDKSVECFALMLACINLGVTYANLDIYSPEERLNKIINR